MNGSDIQHHAKQYASTLPAAELCYPFGEAYAVYKVMGKMFLLCAHVSTEKVVNLKVDPDYSEVLREVYPSIRTGYHMNKRHWISVYAGEKIDKELIEDLVQASYALVVSKLSKFDKIKLSAHQN
ncbi:MmcQ/YjbR family DNA-binding protein [Acinetobacter gerneri]|uniref:MmcQ/YjbR family DNA-binding protein n=1 Tax=Acinetobacter gerneri TaxID=202952 RepID=UPI0029356696|nr:MmcQ/YjbR family DNA-binding protein [Acinetobacter gerneri]MDV2438841.1 MmcQ/YjbR family DNA-binding protein [Acinetobacter gerneri]